MGNNCCNSKVLEKAEKENLLSLRYREKRTAIFSSDIYIGRKPTQLKEEMVFDLNKILETKPIEQLQPE